ncbi:two-component system response regulator TctD [Kushneria sinocarnis]|uniref:Two-component system response regulator TctD n=1 Tax=Kushneria sinocarnis TaxID=595502 RepID=A0A420WU89_9GAMM|nr:response regulator transcription factor [Kushneria sinocarnis]RKQ97008.1 two-component system response regulator TctD [Kushneria sinocarnis]
MRLLLAEDDALLTRAIRQTLTAHGHTLDTLADGEQALHALTTQRFDLVLLDLGLPGCGGLELLSALRDRGDTTPVLILTAHDGLDDRIRGLDLGADDYLAKPFEISELEARVRALLRRSQQRSANQLTFGDITIDLNLFEVRMNGTLQTLPRRELSLLESLMSRAGQLVPRDLLEARLFGFEAVGSNALDLYISRLRKRLDGHGLRIRTIRGLGYVLEEIPAS